MKSEVTPDSAIQQPSPDLVGIGAGGHARAMISVARRCGWRVSRLLESPESDSSVDHLDGVGVDRMLENADFEPQRWQGRPPAVAIFIGTGRGTNIRTRVFNQMLELGVSMPSLIDPSAHVDPSAELGQTVHVLPQALIAAGAKLGRGVLLNHRAIIEHDCRIGDHVHVATGAVLCGGVDVCQGAFIGASAVLLPGVRVGAGAIVGAGAVVTKDIPAEFVVAGNPARPLRSARAA